MFLVVFLIFLIWGGVSQLIKTKKNSVIVIYELQFAVEKKIYIKCIMSVFTKERLEGIDTSVSTAEVRLGDLDTSMNAAEARLGDLDASVGVVESNLGGLDTSMDAAEVRLGDLDTSMNAAEARLGDLDTSMNAADGRLDGLDASVGVVESNLGTFKLVEGTISTPAYAKGQLVISADGAAFIDINNLRYPITLGDGSVVTPL
jgi:hypothetical protein